MNAATERVTLDIPKEDIRLFRIVARRFGWRISDGRDVHNDNDALIDEFIGLLPTTPQLSEEEIMEEVKVVRYGK